VRAALDKRIIDYFVDCYFCR